MRAVVLWQNQQTKGGCILLKKIILAGALLATCAASAEELRCKVIGVARGADIPASQLDAARNFVAAYALEGEWLPAETSLQPGSTCTKSQTRPVSDYPLSLWDHLDPIRKHLPKHFSLGAVMISQRLMFGMDRQITPLDNLLRELEALGVDVGALKLELKSMRYHLEMFDSAAREIGEVVARRRAA